MPTDPVQPLSPEEIEAIRERAEKATPGPWAIESCGEKGDGSNMVGVVFGPDDPDCRRPLSGWLADFDAAGEEIDYYRDELVAECEHRNRNSNLDADFIAHARTDVPRLLATVEAQAGKIAELEREKEADAAEACQITYDMGVRLQARIAELEAALAPFARFAPQSGAE